MPMATPTAATVRSWRKAGAPPTRSIRPISSSAWTWRWRLGTNHISIQAVDWAGNAATTNFAYVFGTNGNPAPPSLTLLWPADGTHVSGDSFTVQAWTDDDTAAVALQYTDANSMVQTINGLVERGGNVWVPGVPLTAGTNRLTLLATNAAGKVSTNSFSVIQSDLGADGISALPDAMQYGYATVYVTVEPGLRRLRERVAGNQL